MQSSSSRLPLALPGIAADPTDPLEDMNWRFFGMQEAPAQHSKAQAADPAPL
jgi:hypothetical protein